MTTPVLEAVNKKYPALLVDIVGDKRSSSLLETFPYIKNIFNKNKRANLSEQLKFLQNLRRVKYDLILDLRTPFLPFLLKGKKKLVNSSKSNLEEHSVYKHFRIVNKILPNIDTPPSCKLYLPITTQKQVALVHDLKSKNDFFVIAPGANWSKKMWSGLKYGCLIDSVIKKKLVNEVILLGNAEDKKIELGHIENMDKVLDLRGQTKLLEAACIIHDAKLFIGNDSGLGHIAAGVGCKTLTLFGPGDHQRYRPWHNDGFVLLAPDSNLDNLTLNLVIDEVTGICSCE